MLTWQVAAVLMFLAAFGGFLLGAGLGVAARATAYQAGYAAARMAALRERFGIDVEAPAHRVPLASLWERPASKEEA